MFITQRIYELLEAAGKSQRELLEAIGKKNSNGMVNSLLGKDQNDIKVSNLEKIADYFGVSIDYFFDRDSTLVGVLASGNNNHIHHIQAEAGQKTIEVQQKLIEEKDKRIELLEQMIEILKQGRSQDAKPCSKNNL